MLHIEIQELENIYGKLLDAKIMTPLFVWGAPGIGKSQVIHQAAQKRSLSVIDVRLSQLTPSDIRGLPVVDHKNEQARFYPPDFLPKNKNAKAILFLDEFNQAPPVLQGIVQQLVLDRRIGDYVLPDGVFIIAAGNRKQDRAAIFDLTAPVANRFIHITVNYDLGAWRRYALQNGIHEHIIAFLGFRGGELLHDMSSKEPAWPSPRSWSMASVLHQQQLPISMAVGAGVGLEFDAFLSIYDSLPDIDLILSGKKADDIELPKEPSSRWATITALVMRAKKAEEAINATRWLIAQNQTEWVQRYFSDALPHMREIKMLSTYAGLIDKSKDKSLKNWLDKYISQYA